MRANFVELPPCAFMSLSLYVAVYSLSRLALRMVIVLPQWGMMGFFFFKLLFTFLCFSAVVEHDDKHSMEQNSNEIVKKLKEKYIDISW